MSLKNDALLLKHLHEFYNKADIIWLNLIWSKYYINKILHASREVGLFWWKDVQRLNTIFRGFAHCTLGDGTTVTFWEDLWSNEILAQHFPRLFSFARNGNISMNEVMSAKNLDNIFILPVLQEAFEELQAIRDHLLICRPLIKKVRMSGHINGATQHTCQTKFYKLVFKLASTSNLFLVVEIQMHPRMKFFAWLVLVDRLNTKTMLRRRNLYVEDHAYCILCTEGIDEDLDHLFFIYPFSERCWEVTGIH